jgi:hypothetical protein
MKENLRRQNIPFNVFLKKVWLAEMLKRLCKDGGDDC